MCIQIKNTDYGTVVFCKGKEKEMKNATNNNSFLFEGDPTLKSVNDASYLFGSYICKELDTIGMRWSYRHVMRPLMENDSLTQLQLVNLTKLKAPTISITLRNMEREGIVERVKEDGDRRETHVSITEKGRELYASIMTALEKAEEIMLSGLTEEELAAVKVVIDKMNANMNNALGGDAL